MDGPLLRLFRLVRSGGRLLLQREEGRAAAVAAVAAVEADLVADTVGTATTSLDSREAVSTTKKLSVVSSATTRVRKVQSQRGGHKI